MDEQRVIVEPTKHFYKLIRKVAIKEKPEESLQTLNKADNAANINNPYITHSATHGKQLSDKFKTQSGERVTVENIYPNIETNPQITGIDDRLSLKKHEKSNRLPEPIAIHDDVEVTVCSDSPRTGPKTKHNSKSKTESNIEFGFNKDHSYCNSTLQSTHNEETTRRMSIADSKFEHMYMPWKKAQVSSVIFKHGEIKSRIAPGTFTDSIHHCTGHPDLTLLEDEALPQPGQIFETRDEFLAHMNSNARKWHFYVACEKSASKSLIYIYRCANYKCNSRYTSTGMRQKESKKTACPCIIKLKRIARIQALVVTYVCHHHDHLLTEESFLKMAHGKHFPHSLKQEIKDLLLLGVSIEVMKKYILSKTGFDMSMKYFNNMRIIALANRREMAANELKMVTNKREELQKLYGDLVEKKNDDTSQSSVNIETRKHDSNSEEPALDKAPEMDTLEPCIESVVSDEETLESLQELQESVQDCTELNLSPLQSQPDLSKNDICSFDQFKIKVSQSNFANCTGHSDLNLLEDEALPQPGQIFESRDDFLAHMNSNSPQWHFYVVCGTSESKYMTYIYRCANFKCNSRYTTKGLRKKKSKKTACPCTIKLKHITSKDDALVVTYVCHHHDHPLTKENFLKMSHGKHFSNSLKQEIKDLLFLGVPKEVMKKYILSKTGFDMSLKYFYNMKRKANAREMTLNELKMVTSKREELEKLYGDLVIKKNTSQFSPKKNTKSTRKRGSNSKEPALDKAPKMGRLETCLQIISRDEETLMSVQKLQESMQDCTEWNLSTLQPQPDLWNSNLITPNDIQNDTNIEVSIVEHSGGDINFFETETSQINMNDETDYVDDVSLTHTKYYQDNDDHTTEYDNTQESDFIEKNILKELGEAYEGHSKQRYKLSKYKSKTTTSNISFLRLQEESSTLKKKLDSISSNYSEVLSSKDVLFKENLELKKKVCQGEDDISKLKQELSNIKEELATVTSKCAKAFLMKDLFLKENLTLKKLLYNHEDILKCKKESLNLKNNLESLSSDYANALSINDLVHKENLELKSKLRQKTLDAGVLKTTFLEDKMKLSKEIHQLKVSLSHARNALDKKESSVAKKDLHVDIDYERRKKKHVELEPFQRLAGKHKLLDACYIKAVKNVNGQVRKTFKKNKEGIRNLVNNKDLSKQKNNKSYNSRAMEQLTLVGDRDTEDKRTNSQVGNKTVEPDKGKTKDKTYSNVDIIDADGQSDPSVVLCEMENDLANIEIEILDSDYGASDMENYEMEVLDSDFDL